MSAIKKEALKIVEALGESEDWEDLMYKIYVRESIEKGLNDIDAQNTFSQVEVDQRLSKWLE